MILDILKILALTYCILSAVALVLLLLSFGLVSVRFWAEKNIEALAYIVSIFIYPIVYVFRKPIDNNPKLFKWLLLYWFANSDEDNYIDNWYGVYELLESYDDFYKMNWLQKFILSYQWGAIRNPHWNLKLLLGKHLIGTIYDKVEVICKGITCNQPNGYMIWRNKTIFGKQYALFKVNGLKQFRYSFTRPLKNWSPFRWMGYNNINLMLGTGESRYISKLRVFK